ncbi:MAG: hypothetical protein ACRC42_05175, partial [Mycoplasma sp.]
KELGDGTSSGNNKYTRPAKWDWSKSGTYKIKEIIGQKADKEDYTYTPTSTAAGHTIQVKSILDSNDATDQVVDYRENEKSFIVAFTNLDLKEVPKVQIDVAEDKKIDTKCLPLEDNLSIECTFNPDEVPLSSAGYDILVFNKCNLKDPTQAPFALKIIGVIKKDITKVTYDAAGETTKCLEAITNDQDITIEYDNVEGNVQTSDQGTCVLVDGSDNGGCVLKDLLVGTSSNDKHTRPAKWEWSKSGTYKIKEIKGSITNGSDYIFTPTSTAAGHTIQVKSILDSTDTTDQTVNYSNNENTVIITYTNLDDKNIPDVKIAVGANEKNTVCKRDGSTLKVKCTFTHTDVPASADGYTVKVYNKCDSSANN